MPAPSTTSTTIDIESEAFALRLANLLRATRADRGSSMRGLAKASEGRFTKVQLIELESATVPLDEEVVTAVAALYGADLGTILPSRLPVSINGHVISAGGVEATFTPMSSTSLLTAYLRLIRSMRRQKKAPMIALRREDIEVLAEFLDEPGETIVDRLTALMGATLNQRTAMATMFATGAIVIGLAGATVASAPETPGSSDPASDSTIEISLPASTPSLDGTSVITVAVPADELPAADVAAAEAVQDAGHAIVVVDAGTADETPTDEPAGDASASGDVLAGGDATDTPVPVAGGSAVDAGADAADAGGSDAGATADDGSVAVDVPAMPVVDLSTGIDATPMPTDDLTWLDGEPGTVIPTSAVISGFEVPMTPTTTATTTPPVVAVDPPAVTPADVATEAPPIPSAVSSFAPTAEARSLVSAPTMESGGTATKSDSRRAALQERRAHRAAKRNTAALHRIESRAAHAIERATNRIYIEADEERIAALQVISARAEAALATAARQLFVHGSGARAQETFDAVREEVYARADADKDDVLDVIYTRAHADKLAITQRIQAQAAQARADLGLT